MEPQPTNYLDWLIRILVFISGWITGVILFTWNAGRKYNAIETSLTALAEAVNNIQQNLVDRTTCKVHRELLEERSRRHYGEEVHKVKDELKEDIGSVKREIIAMRTDLKHCKKIEVEDDSHT